MLDWRHIQAYEAHRTDLLQTAKQEHILRLALAGNGRHPAREAVLAWLGSRLSAWGESLQERAGRTNLRVPKPAEDSQGRAVIARLVVFTGEVYRLPAECRGLRVIAGKAWITYGGRDIVLKRCERTMLERPDDLALLSALGASPLVVEALGRTRRSAGGMSSAPALIAA